MASRSAAGTTGSAALRARTAASVAARVPAEAGQGTALRSR